MTVFIFRYFKKKILQNVFSKSKKIPAIWTKTCQFANPEYIIQTIIKRLATLFCN